MFVYVDRSLSTYLFVGFGKWEGRGKREEEGREEKVSGGWGGMNISIYTDRLDSRF
jgi:hypothetical protein